ncbi:hypothetical protein JCM19237_263 [Photobacterium aphoticum]|uniref:Uncharacterized protein n=1 Tax=Photobacterium aphoticum TaxID=754436 RepID=A0A090R031_9GAMM|nr:hypothetical protein JCM19237_263 [Photobacterium aphoticum]
MLDMDTLTGRLSVYAMRLVAAAVAVTLACGIVGGTYYATMPWRAKQEANAILIVGQAQAMISHQGTQAKTK